MCPLLTPFLLSAAFQLSIPSFREEYIANHELDRLLDSMKEVSYKKGQIIMEEGAPVKSALHIIRTGKVTVVSNKGEINNLTSGGHFGESTLAMTASDKASATINAIEDVVCHVLTKADVEKVIGSVSRLGKPRALINARDRKDYVDYANLKKIRILGMGRHYVSRGTRMCVADCSTIPHELKFG